MSKRKREKMKQKELRHRKSEGKGVKAGETDAPGAFSSSAGADRVSSHKSRGSIPTHSAVLPSRFTPQAVAEFAPHLRGISPEWRKFYDMIARKAEQ